MADNNYSQQPFHGFPFQFPPQMQQPPHASAGAGAQGGQHGQMQHAPFQIPGLSMPMLQQSSSPSANQLSFGQNSQQPPFSPALGAWQPQDHAFFTIMQQAMVNGQPPPPFPGFGFPPPFPPHTPQQQAPPMAYAPQPAQSQHVPAGARIEEAVGSDREDGEVSEGEVGARPRADKVNGQRYHETPRSVPQTHAKAAPPPAHEEYNPAQPAAGQKTVREPMRKAPQPVPPPKSPADVLQETRDQAKQFVKLLHSNNIGYRALANEPLDLDQLRGLYQSLNLPSEPATILPPKPVAAQVPSPSLAVQPVPNKQNVQQKPAPTVKTNASADAQAKAGPPDRSDYIARLQAAKLAKASAAQKTPPSAATPSAPAVQTPQATATPSNKRPITDEARARNTEVIRQRMEALKAGKAALAANATPSARSPTQKAIEQSAPSGVSTPNSQSYKSPFPGIPGLFMNPHPSYNDNAFGTTPSASQNHIAPTDSQELHQDESMVFDPSGDESHGSDMDIDDDQAPSQSAVASPTSRLLGPPGMPPAHAASSAASTPGTPTPAIQGREQELQSKEDQLAAMRITLKKKLAEKREKDKAAAAAAAALQNQPRIQPIKQAHAPITPRTASSAMMAQAEELIRDEKRLRKEAIRSQLLKEDAEFAKNAEERAELLKQAEVKRIRNEKIAEDKQRLTLELENLGVDTEGMSHAEMREKKDEIDEEISEPQDGARSTLTLEETLQPPTKPTQDIMEVAQQPEAVEEPVVDEASKEPVIPSSLQNLKYPKAPSQAATVDEVPVPQTELLLPAVQQSTMEGAPLPKEPAFTIAPPTAQETGTPLDEDDDFYSPAPAAAPALEDSMDLDNSIQTQMAADVKSPSEEGEVEMSLASDDEEEEYEPEEPVIVDDAPTQNAQVSEVEKANSAASEDILSEEEEAYEPPDVDEDLLDVPAEQEVAAVDGVVPEPEADDGAMDIASSSDDSDSDSDSSDGEITSGNNETISANHGQLELANVANDLAQELQPDSASELISTADDEPEVPKFTPYESPLRMFKSYRYHPNFAQDVSGGFLSPTFSHQIDPEKPFCQYETAGGSCNDPECPNQHFRGVGINGETLLVQLGTANPGKTSEEKQRWNDGLRQVLKELRKKSIKDPNGIAVEIAKYRRQFLHDDTRVINL